MHKSNRGQNVRVLIPNARGQHVRVLIPNARGQHVRVLIPNAISVVLFCNSLFVIKKTVNIEIRIKN